MKKIAVIIFVFVIFLSFAGCSTIEVYDNVFREKILIVSDPPGAKIEVNNEYLGDTPYKLQIESYVPCEITIYAYPPSLSTEKYFLQKKTIYIYYDYATKGIFFPAKVYFDMRQRELAPRIDQWTNVK